MMPRLPNLSVAQGLSIFLLAVLSATLSGCGEEEEEEASEPPRQCQQVLRLLYGNTTFPATYFFTEDTDDCKKCCRTIEDFTAILKASSANGAVMNRVQTELCGRDVNDQSSIAGSVWLVCQSCAAAQVPPQSLETWCESCAPGSYSETGRGECAQCPAAEYAPAFGSTTCTTCPQGKYGVQEGSATQEEACQDCDAGYSSYEGATACYKCPAGKWSGVGFASCTPCIAGTFSFQEGAPTVDTCTECPKGRYGEDEGRSEECSKCPPGSWNNDTAKTSLRDCILCKKGTFSTVEAAIDISSCQDCQPGSYTKDLGQSECLDCGTGTFSVGAADTCTFCQPGRYQSVIGATECDKCQPGRMNHLVGSNSSSSCLGCPSGTYSGESANRCTLCEPGKFAPDPESITCLNCSPKSASPRGAHACCPVRADSWPAEPVYMAIPPGKYYTSVYKADMCNDDGEMGGSTEVIDPEMNTGLDKMPGKFFVGTMHKEVSYECEGFNCEAAHCAVDAPGSDAFMPGMDLFIAAHVYTTNASTPPEYTKQFTKCAEMVALNFVSKGCEPGTVFLFMCTLVIVVGTTILCGLLFDQAFKTRMSIFLESSLLVTGDGTDADRLPSIRELRRDVGAALWDAAANRERPEASQQALTATRLTHLKAWKVPKASDESEGRNALLVEFKAWTPKKVSEELRRRVLAMTWQPGKNWDSAVQVVPQPPALVKEAAKLPGADLMETIELFLLRCCRCCGRADVTGGDPEQVHREAAEKVLERLMSGGAKRVLAMHAFLCALGVVGLPTYAFYNFTCIEGYPFFLHGIWLVLICWVTRFTNWWILSGCDIDEFRSRFRARMWFRFFVTVMSWTDLYQDATFPVIAGICGFDLWFVALWLCCLGTGVMQLLVQLFLIWRCYQRWKNASTPQEKFKLHVEGIFLALRGCDNHEIVFAVKPAVEECLGGASSWTMKTVEMRVAFLRFVFEDAEQSALQVVFLLHFQNASWRDRIWVGCSCVTSILVSFTLCVQTLAEVRDWVWHQILIRFPGSASSLFRLIWLFILIAVYRAISIFPWLGSCTPAGDYTESAITRLFLMSDRSPPRFVLKEALYGSALAVILSSVLVLIAACVWRKSLNLTLCGKNRNRHKSKTTALDSYSFKDRVETAGAAELSLKTDEDGDGWLAGLRTIWSMLTDDLKASDRIAETKHLIQELDRMLVKLVRSGSFTGGNEFARLRVRVENLLEELSTACEEVMPSEVSSPKAGDLQKKIIEVFAEVKEAVLESLETAELQGRVHKLLASPAFRSMELRLKVEAIEEATQGKAGLQLLPLQVLIDKGLEKGAGVKLDPAIDTWSDAILPVYVSHTWLRHDSPDDSAGSKAKALIRFGKWLEHHCINSGIRREDYMKVHFWVDYCCMLQGSAGVVALPLYVAACSQVVTMRTRDFDRRCWTMMERLLAYSFCPGGMMPYAIDATAFGCESGEKDGGSDDEGTACAAVIGKGSEKGVRKVVPEPKKTEADNSMTVLRRVRKLPNPLDPMVCKLSVSTSGAQRRQLQSLVEVALAVPALETFGDRQPVEFGLTEVVEHMVGHHRPLNSCTVDNSLEDLAACRIDGDKDYPCWITAQPAPEEVREWQLVVEKPPEKGATADAALHRGSSEGKVVLIDRSEGRGDMGTAPSREEINELFEAMDKAYEAASLDISGTSKSQLEGAAVRLVSALRADLRSASDSKSEERMRQAFAHTRDVELPEKYELSRSLCRMQLQNALLGDDIVNLDMAISFVKQQGVTDLPEFEKAQARREKLKADKIRLQTLKAIEAADDVGVIVSALDVVAQKGWDDLLEQGYAKIREAMENGGVDAHSTAMALADSGRSDPRVANKIAVMTRESITQMIDKAMAAKDVAAVATLAQIGKKAAFSKNAAGALRVWIEECKGIMLGKPGPEQEEARTILKAIVEKTIGVQGLKSENKQARDVVNEVEEMHKAKKAEALDLIARMESPGDIMTAAQIGHTYFLQDVIDAAAESFKLMVENASGPGGVETISLLAELYDAAQAESIPEFVAVVEPVLQREVEALASTAEPEVLAKLAGVAESKGLSDYAAAFRQALRPVLDRLKDSEAMEDRQLLFRIKEAADAAGDAQVMQLVENAISATEAREEEHREEARRGLASASSAAEVVLLMCASRSFGWKDITAEGAKLLNTRLHEALAEERTFDDADIMLLAATEVVTAHEAGVAHHAHDVSKSAAKIFSSRVQAARKKRRGWEILVLHSAARAEDSSRLSKISQEALTEMIDSWVQAGGTALPTVNIEKFLAVAATCGGGTDTDRLQTRLHIGEQLAKAKAANDIVSCGEVYQTAAVIGATGIQREAREAFTESVQQLKGKPASKDVSYKLRQARQLADKCGLHDILSELSEVADLIEQMQGATAAGDAKGLFTVIATANKCKCPGIEEDAKGFAKDLISQRSSAKSEKDILAAVNLLKDWHDAARTCGLHDLAQQAATAASGLLPEGWAKGEGKLEMLKKVAESDTVLIARIQQLMDATYRGWGRMGPDCVTRDRKFKTKNPLGQRLKVEQVIHVENASNYLSFATRKADIKKALAGVPDAEKTRDWNFRTHAVSLQGVKGFDEDPIDKGINECWLWHGTGEAGVKGITDADFDMVRAGSATGSMFGRGLYFAESCMKADEYTQKDSRGFLPVLLCRVVLGRCNHCDARHPADLSSELEASCKSGEYHSVIGDREAVVGTYRELIVFDNDQVYPEFVIWYSREEPFKKTF
eukprot:TRINITY_DN35261_c0_g2_i1.p1 TRINITY_DN35261_c0_g2~~TRINITY_DN35261_c0_g2_i1.p1  ORF type:complete len:2747 (-),score=615.84 TRINITY_DN35261_c0_g2_i1:144-8384(-)